MQLLARFEGIHGRIFVIEEKATGARRYYEGGSFQSHAWRTGESCFTYVHLMKALLQPARDVLVLGCAGGTLATMLHRQGKSVTVIDRNPLSFMLAREYFWMPSDVRCIAADFKDFITYNRDCFDAIAVDVGGPGFDYAAEFDEMTCRTLHGRLSHSGRIAMNVLIEYGMDLLPDITGKRLATPDLQAWVIDEVVREPERNAIVACVPERDLNLEWENLPDAISSDAARWLVRHSQLASMGQHAR